MGICGSKNASAERAAKESKEIEKALNADQIENGQINKILLLGAGESGKSTLFKQMFICYGNGFPKDEINSYREVISSNMVNNMVLLINASENKNIGASIDAGLASDIEAVKSFKSNQPLTPELAGSLQRLWTDAGVQKTFANRSKFQLVDNADYFFNKIEEVSKPGYTPSTEDVLRARVRTTGIVENSFAIEGTQFKMFDVGGQRNERKKWIHCFEKVTAVLFVAAISAFNQTLYEDGTTNRLEEALNLFSEISNSKWFAKTSIILFLNKKDLFKLKLEASADGIKPFFPDYTGSNDPVECAKFLENKFKERCKGTVYSHVTCATDSENVSHVFNSIKDIIIRQSLDEAGILVYDNN